MTAPAVSDLLPGYDLDRRVAEAYGFSGETFWMCTRDGGESCMDSFTARHAAENWVKKMQARHLGYETLRVVERIDYPRFSTDMRDAWTIVERMARRGWKVDVQNRASGWACHVAFPAPNYSQVFERAEPLIDGKDVTAALAICRASLKAIESSALTLRQDGAP